MFARTPYPRAKRTFVQRRNPITGDIPPPPAHPNNREAAPAQSPSSQYSRQDSWSVPVTPTLSASGTSLQSISSIDVNVGSISSAASFASSNGSTVRLEENSCKDPDIKALQKEHAQQLAASRRDPQALPGEVGLENPVGANNCFLNVIIQALAHIPHTRDGFQQDLSHLCQDNKKGHLCVVCAIQAVFMQYTYGQNSHVPPNELRKTIARLYEGPGRFQLGETDDAPELFENLADHIHTTITGEGKCDLSYGGKPCLMHETFAMVTRETTNPCSKCKKRNDEVTYQHFLQNLPVYEMLQERQLQNALYNYNHSEEQPCRHCDKERVRVVKNIDRVPKILAINLQWHTDAATSDEVRDVVGKIDEIFSLSACFTVKKPTQMLLVGAVCFYGRHYVCYFRSARGSKEKPEWGQWVHFDDSRVRPANGWRDVCKEMVKARYQPNILFYAETPQST